MLILNILATSEQIRVFMKSRIDYSHIEFVENLGLQDLRDEQPLFV